MTLTVDDRELIEKARRVVAAGPLKGQIVNPLASKLSDHLQSLLSERDKLEQRVRELEGLISVRSIERLAADIAIACVDCRPEIREPRHSAMVRLGERLRKPLSSDIAALRSTDNG